MKVKVNWTPFVMKCKEFNLSREQTEIMGHMVNQVVHAAVENKLKPIIDAVKNATND